MKVKFCNFAKRQKSTAIYTGEYALELDVTWKDKTPITTPVITCSTAAVSTYNYCYIADWGRYYFVREITTIDHMWEISLEEDYLASYKAGIGATSANILYASGSTKSIVDSRIPVLSTVIRGHNYKSISGMTITASNGVPAAIIGVTGKGSFGSYLLQDSNKLPDLLDGIDAFWTNLNIQNVWDALLQFFYGGSTSECLKSAIGIPLVLSASDVSSGSAEDLYLGNYPCKDGNGNNIKGYRITKKVVVYNDTIDIPWGSSDWKKIAGYTNILLYLPLCGMVEINATEAQNDAKLNITYSVNVTSGDITVNIKGNESGRFLGAASGNCAVAEAFGSTGIDTTKMMSTGITTGLGLGAAVATGGGSLAGKAAIGALIGNAAVNTISALGGSGSGSGGLGGGSSYGQDRVCHCFVTQKVLSDTQANFDPIMGKPYMGVATVGSFSGFVQTDGFQFAGGLALEREQINNMLDTGIYYE